MKECYDKDTRRWFKEHPFAETTVMQCEKCGLFYKPILGHKCPKKTVENTDKLKGGKGMKKTVVFDFDGVIHSYKSGWQGVDVIPDPAVPGIREAIDEIRKAGYEVVVVSTRCASESGMTAIYAYLEENDIKVDDVVAEKPPAIVYIDDRAICFDGNAEGLLDKINGFKPWYFKEG